MRKIIILLFTLVLGTVTAFAQTQDGSSVVANFIRTKSDIREGGADLFEYQEESFIIAVASVKVGNKGLLDCRKVGDAKAKKVLLSFINGSDITSHTKIEYTEEVVNGEAVTHESYTEHIRETVLGMINQCKPFTEWYSEDGAVFYYAIKKTI